MRTLNRLLLAIIALGVVAVLSTNHVRGQVWKHSKIHGRPSPPLPYRVVPAFPRLKFENPTCVVEIPGANELMVAHGSRLEAFPKQNSVTKTRLVGDLGKIAGGHVAIKHAAFHPRFSENRFLFVCHDHFEGGAHLRVSRYTLTDDPQPTVVPGSATKIITWPTGGHSGGCLQFHPDGSLYISTGDGTGPSPPDGRTTGQDISDLLGSLLRIDVNGTHDDVNYVIPKDNPFVNTKDARPEVWSYGLRNPWKFGIDEHSGDVFVADNGWETWELIHKMERGSNGGWPIMEGRARLRPEVARGPTPITPPVKDHHHSEANSVIGGPIYRGSALPDLQGYFIYGDYIMGTIWALRIAANGELEHRTLADCEYHIVAFTETSEGNVYLLDYDRTGKLYQLVESDEVDTSAEFPRKLSETGIFVSTQDRTPSPGVHSYAIVAEPWHDRARSQRWIAVPTADEVRLDTADPRKSSFPEGTVLVKHLSMGATSRPLETQLLHYHRGEWNPYSYLWNDAGTDAALVDPQGTNVEIQRTNGPDSLQTWHVGAENECRLCHNTANGPVLGFTARQLDNPRDSGENQLAWLTSSGVLREPPAGTDALPNLVDPYDTHAHLNDRGRSYLHVNCGICHNESGPATISFYAHRDYPFDQLRITKRPGIGRFGMNQPRLVSAGHPYESIILYRISKLGYGRMPYVGSRVVDSRGVDLVAAWIESLDPNGTSANESLRSLSEGNRLRTQQIDRLLESTEGALALSTAMHRKQLVQDNERYILQSLPKTTGDVRGIFAHFLPESKRRRTLGSNPDVQVILRRQGDASNGKLIFLSDDARCRNCHDLSDATNSVGPTLAAIRKKYKERRELLKHILEPSLQMDEQFATWSVVTTGGEVISGLLVARHDRGVTLQLADKTKRQIDQDDIDVIERGSRSVMPDGVMSDLTPQEAADLLSFLLGK